MSGRWRWFLHAMVLLTIGVFVTRAVAQEKPVPFDTLDVQTILGLHRTALDSLLLPTSISFDTTGIATLGDSLDRGGAAAVRLQRKHADRAHAHDFSLGFVPLAMTTYNRVDGMRVGSGIQPSYGRALRGDVAAAYAFSSHEWAGRAALELGRSRGPVGRVGWSDELVPFGPVPGGESLGFLALVAGQDLQDYLRRRELEFVVWPWRRARSHLRIGVFDRQDESRDAATDFNLIGGGVPMNESNPSIDEWNTAGGTLAAQYGGEEDRARVSAEVGVVVGDGEWSWQTARARVAPIVTGGTLSLELEGTNLAGGPPVQDAAYLGGEGNLRGYDRLEFQGKRRATARIEYALGIDLLERSRIPGIERAHLQFVPFFDAGTTWGETRAVAGSKPPLEGDPRASMGLGMRRTLWLPGLMALRLDIARRLDRGDDAWGFWLRVVPIDL